MVRRRFEPGDGVFADYAELCGSETGREVSDRLPHSLPPLRGKGWGWGGGGTLLLFPTASRRPAAVGEGCRSNRQSTPRQPLRCRGASPLLVADAIQTVIRSQVDAIADDHGRGEPAVAQVVLGDFFE